MIYYVLDDTAPIYALLVYAKGARIDMNADQKKTVSALASAIKASYRSTR